MKRTGILGGTFDPVHNGHLLIGRQAYFEYDLDEVWFMPSHIPAYKSDHDIASPADRMNMISLAIGPYPYFSLSDFEMRREGNTYTAQTLPLLRKEYPDREFYFIIGADSLYNIETWYHPEEVMRLARILVSGREFPGAECSLEEEAEYLKDRYGAVIDIIHSDTINISSEEIRERVTKGLSIEGSVPEAVASYIYDNDLYRKPECIDAPSLNYPPA